MRSVVALTLLILAECSRTSEYVSVLADELEDLTEEIRELMDAYDQYNKWRHGGKHDHSKILEDLDENSELSFEQAVKENLTRWNEVLREQYSARAFAQWDYSTNITDSNAKKLSDLDVKSTKELRKITSAARAVVNNAHFKDLDTDTKRQLVLMAHDTSPQNDDDVEKLETAKQALQKIYAVGKLKKNGSTYSLEPDLQDILAKSRNPEELLWAWKGWRDVTGPQMKVKYEELVAELNKGARENNFADYGEAWREDQFDNTPNLKEICEQLWQQLEPIYKQLHAYVRRKLYEFYGDSVVQWDGRYGGIPAHLLGNMWAQNWENIYEIVKPYPDVSEPDIDKAMKDQDYTVDKMFNMAEDFYTSLGLSSMTQDFKDNSLKVKPDDRDVQCHASAFDFYKSGFFRIKMCTEVDMGYLDTIHHEMGHIEYFMQYANLPAVYRTGANSAFHEAIGDTISLSVMSIKHLKRVGLIHEETKRDNEQSKKDINYLMKRALFKLGFLPFGYMIDKWRWEVFNGTIGPDEYNRRWWELRLQYQGLVSPIPRSEADFDPGAKFHIPSNSPYICYFISFITQFQFYKALCDESGHTGDLFQCDFYQSKTAGDNLKAMLVLGKSKAWPDAMEVLTGHRHVDASAIIEYFQPLIEWLQQENERTGETIGWDKASIKWETT